MAFLEINPSCALFNVSIIHLSYKEGGPEVLIEGPEDEVATAPYTAPGARVIPMMGIRKN